MRDNVTTTVLNVIGDSCKQIYSCVKEKGGYFEHKL